MNSPDRLRGALTPLTQRELEYLALKRTKDLQSGRPLTAFQIARSMGVRLSTVKSLARVTKEKVDALRAQGTNPTK